MTIEPIPFEVGRFIVASETDADSAYVVDLCWQENPWNKPIVYCGCHQFFCKGKKMCKHIEATVEFELNRLQL